MAIRLLHTFLEERYSLDLCFRSVVGAMVIYGKMAGFSACDNQDVRCNERWATSTLEVISIQSRSSIRSELRVLNSAWP